MTSMMIAFPGIFILFAVFFGYISYSIMINKKPVVIRSKWLLALVAIGFLPSISINFIAFFQKGGESVLTLVAPIMFLVLLVFYYFILKGVSIYGITDEDFKKYFFMALSNLNIRFTEKMNKVQLDDAGTDIHVSFQESIGTGMIKIKDPKKADFKKIVSEFKKVLAANTIHTKKITAWFYLVFALLMIVACAGFIYLLITKVL